MPLYEYKCLRCGYKFEILQKFDEVPAKKCTRCGGHVKRVISPPALQFKGDGWYVTDYTKKSEKKEKKEEKPADKEKSTPKKNSQ